MTIEPDRRPDFDSLKTLLLEMAQERSWDALVSLIGKRLLERPHVALVRLWLVEPGDICGECAKRPECPDQTNCLHLVASAGKPFSEAGEAREELGGDYRRVPLGIGKIGRVATEQKPVVIEDLQQGSKNEINRAWAREQNIKGFAAFPLIYKGEVLGVSGLFSETDQIPEGKGEGLVWGQIIADHMAAAIANAKAFDKTQRLLGKVKDLSKFPSENPNPIMRVDKEGTILYANLPALTLLMAWNAKAGDPILPFFHQPLEKARATNLSHSIEVDHDGKTFSFEVMPVPGAKYVNIYGKDITEKKQAQKSLRFAHFTIEHAGDMVIWIDSDARISQANRVACDRLGYTRDELLSMRVFDIDPDVQKEQWPGIWNDLREQKFLMLESRNRARDGSIFPVEVSSNFFEFEGKEYACSFIRDITERKRAQEKVTQLTLEKKRLEGELKFASMVQREFLPKNLPRHPHYNFAAKTIPAKFVGGDFYDFIRITDDKLGILLGDVSGKGVSAALHMAGLMSDFRSISLVNPDPGHVMNQMNAILSSRAQGGLFATAVYLLIDLKTQTVQAANAGHHPVLICHKDHRIDEKVSSGGIPLGVFSDTLYPQEEIQLSDGDLMLLYTDGAVESRNESQELFGMDRLRHLVEEDCGSPNELLAHLETSIQTFAHPAYQQDDLTFVAVKVL